MDHRNLVIAHCFSWFCSTWDYATLALFHFVRFEAKSLNEFPGWMSIISQEKTQIPVRQDMKKKHQNMVWAEQGAIIRSRYVSLNTYIHYVNLHDTCMQSSLHVPVLNILGSDDFWCADRLGSTDRQESWPCCWAGAEGSSIALIYPTNGYIFPQP